MLRELWKWGTVCLVLRHYHRVSKPKTHNVLSSDARPGWRETKTLSLAGLVSCLRGQPLPRSESDLPLATTGELPAHAYGSVTHAIAALQHVCPTNGFVPVVRWSSIWKPMAAACTGAHSTCTPTGPRASSVLFGAAMCVARAEQSPGLTQHTKCGAEAALPHLTALPALPQAISGMSIKGCAHICKNPFLNDHGVCNPAPTSCGGYNAEQSAEKAPYSLRCTDRPAPCLRACLPDTPPGRPEHPLAPRG